MKTQKSLQELQAEAKAQIEGKLTQLKSKFPRVFSQLDWLNFDIEDGWIDLIERLSAVIETYLDISVPAELRDQVHFVQIKQKFGQLRVHMNNYTPYIQGAIAMAEVQSYTICEKCGERGTLRNMSWITTLCDIHHQQKLAE